MHQLVCVHASGPSAVPVPHHIAHGAFCSAHMMDINKCTNPPHQQVVGALLGVAIVGYLLGSSSGGMENPPAHTYGIGAASGGELDLQAAIAREVRTQLLDQVTHKQASKTFDASEWPPVNSLSESQRKRILGK